MPDDVTTWYIDEDNEQRSGLYLSLGTTNPAPVQRFMRDLILTTRIAVVKPAPRGSGRVWDLRDLAGAQFEVGIGLLDKPPTLGTFPLSFNASGVGLEALAFNISGPDLQAALNGNAAIAATGGVTVLKTGQLYNIRWNLNGARSLIATPLLNSLSPPSSVIITRLEAGGAGNPEIQTIEIYQKLFASQSVWAPVPVGTVTPTTIFAGSNQSPAQYKIQFSERPVSGDLRVEHSVPQITEITVTKNTASFASVTVDFLNVMGDSGLLNSKYIDIFKADGTPKRFWFNSAGGGTAPPAPVGGVLAEVAYTGAAQLVTNFMAAVDADADFSAPSTLSPSKVYFTYVAKGRRFEMDISGADPHLTSFGSKMVSAGSDGIHAGRRFFLPDRLGVTCVYLAAGITQNEPDLTGLIVNRLIKAEITIDGDASVIADDIADAFNDPDELEFEAVAGGNVVTVTDEFGGARGSVPAKNVTFGVAIKRPGQSLSASIPWDSAPETIRAMAGQLFDVTKPDELTWILTKRVLGEMPDLTVSSPDLKWQSRVEGVLALNKEALRVALAGTTEDLLPAVVEVVMTPSGGTREVIYQAGCELRRNLLLQGLAEGPSWPMAPSRPLLELVYGGPATVAEIDVTDPFVYPDGKHILAIDHPQAFYLYRLNDSGGLPAEDIPRIVHPTLPAGTRYWDLAFAYDYPTGTLQYVGNIDLDGGMLTNFNFLSFLDDSQRRRALRHMVQWEPNLDGYTGGAANHLDAIETANLLTPLVVEFKHATEGLRKYMLRTGVDAHASPNIIRPLDYDGVLNTKVWESLY